MLHAADNIECPADHLKSFLKLFSMFNIRIVYYKTIDTEDVPEAIGILCTNFEKNVSFLVYHQKVENFITPFSQVQRYRILVFLNHSVKQKPKF